jgi:uncharacterized protein (TIGR03435 family)
VESVFWRRRWGSHAVPGRNRYGDDPVVCGFVRTSVNDGVDIQGVTIAGLCRQLTVSVDHDVIDMTGLAGVFDIHLQLTPTDLGYPDVAPGAPMPFTPTDGTAIAVALEKLGVKMKSAKGSTQVLVIDHLERPTEN